MSFRFDVYPTIGGTVMRDEPHVFNYARIDLCPECMIAEIDRMKNEYRMPVIYRSRGIMTSMDD